jgi:hypothetical protein
MIKGCESQLGIFRTNPSRDVARVFVVSVHDSDPSLSVSCFVELPAFGVRAWGFSGAFACIASVPLGFVDLGTIHRRPHSRSATSRTSRGCGNRHYRFSFAVHTLLRSPRDRRHRRPTLTRNRYALLLIARHFRFAPSSELVSRIAARSPSPLSIRGFFSARCHSSNDRPDRFVASSWNAA